MNYISQDKLPLLKEKLDTLSKEWDHLMQFRKKRIIFYVCAVTGVQSQLVTKRIHLVKLKEVVSRLTICEQISLSDKEFESLPKFE